MKTTFKLLLFLPLLLAANLYAGPYTVTNIVVGADSNSVAWGKVNVNNNNYVGWLNAVDATNTLHAFAISNNVAAISNVAATLNFQLTNGYAAPSNTFSIFSLTNGMSPGDFKVFNSNGVALDAVWISNGVPVITVMAPR